MKKYNARTWLTLFSANGKTRPGMLPIQTLALEEKQFDSISEALEDFKKTYGKPGQKLDFTVDGQAFYECPLMATVGSTFRPATATQLKKWHNGEIDLQQGQVHCRVSLIELFDCSKKQMLEAI